MTFFNGLVNLINVAGIITIGIAVSTIFVGVFIYNPKRESRDSDSESNSDSEDEIDYEYMYMDEYEILERKPISDSVRSSYINNFIDEKSPRGTVMLSYDNNETAFIYYSNSKDIPYKYLETISRKFIVDNDCKELYVDYRDELIDGINRYNENIKKKQKLNNDTDNEDNNVKAKKSVFAKFKEYNKTERNVNTKKEYVLTENANRYIYKGTLLDYENYVNDKDNRNNIVNNEYENIDFKTFKQLHGKDKQS